MEQRRSRRLERSGNAERDQPSVDPDDLVIIFPDPLHHPVGKALIHLRVNSLSAVTSLDADKCR